MPWAIAACRTDQRLYEAIPEEYRQGHCFTDFWAAYAAVIPEEQHTAVGKETGETAHVERWNNTVRQRLARFVRMTLSFSRVGDQARGLSAPLSSSLQYRAGHPAHVSHYQKIFDRFYRVSDVQDKTVSGMGLGLYISSEIVKRHGGRLWVESAESEGTTFFISLPIA